MPHEECLKVNEKYLSIFKSTAKERSAKIDFKYAGI